ncbi:hypothetical protein [Legionella bozemanae]|uniref:hypothetical protein n=1 Tax=Legionella bozemanae TaxID=447 RepID=UPI003F70D4C6
MMLLMFMPVIDKKKAHRPITPNEKLYIAVDAMNHSFTLKLILEMDVSSLN